MILNWKASYSVIYDWFSALGRPVTWRLVSSGEQTFKDLNWKDVENCEIENEWKRNGGKYNGGPVASS